MRIFLTGASGFVGSAVTQALLRAGHQVVGLARNDAAEVALKAAGADVHRGDLNDPDSLRKGAAAADAVIHTGFIHDFARFKEVCEIDRVAIGALGDALRGSDKPMLVTSGTALVSPGSLATEDIVPTAGSSAHPRAATEETVNLLVQQGLRVGVVRLSPSVHGDGDHGFVPLLIKLARAKGVSAYIGDGQNRWSAVHRLDAGKLYQLAIEKTAAGARYHGVAESGIPFRDIATAIGKGLGIPAVSLNAEQAAEHFGWFSGFAGIDCPASSKLTQETLGWRPHHTTLLEDLAKRDYFG